MNCLFLLVLLCCANRRTRQICVTGMQRDCSCAPNDSGGRQRSGDGMQQGCDCVQDAGDRGHQDCGCMQSPAAGERRFDERRRGYPFADVVPEMRRVNPGHTDSCNCNH